MVHIGAQFKEAATNFEISRDTVRSNEDPGLDAGEAKSGVLDGKEEVDEEDDAGDDGQDTHCNAGPSLSCT